MTPSTLPISRLINVSVVLTPQAAQSQDLSSLLILGSSDVIDVVERMRTYASLDAVAAEFGTTAPEYLSALLWFAQSPQPTEVKIGRWAEADTPGQLICAPLSLANKVISAWAAINNGSLKVSVDGDPLQSLTGLDFSGVSNLNGVATVINGTLTDSEITYDAVNGRFVITATSTGDGSTVSFLQAGAGGTNIATMLAGLVSSSGAYVADGIDAQTAAETVALFDLMFGQRWYAVVIPEETDNDNNLDVAAYVEASTNKHLFGLTTQEAGVISSVSTTDIAYLLNAAEYKRTFCQYSSSSVYAVASALARMLTTDYNGNNTVIDLMYKQEPVVTPENLTSTQLDAVLAKQANVFVEYNNDTAILQPGNVSSGDPLDIITGTDWLAVTIMTDLYNLLYTNPTKVPQTDAGIHLLVNRVEGTCSQGVTNGLLAPGVWNSGGFGTLQQGQFMPKGFYVYAPPVATQNQAAREARQSPTIQVAAKLAGAVRTVDVIVNVNR